MSIMLNYHRAQEFLVDWLSFEVNSVCYVGTGFLQWDHDSGFHLLARVQQQGSSVLQRSIMPLSITKRVVIQMRFGRNQHAFAPGVYLDDSHLMTDHLSIDIARVIFVQRESRDLSKDSWPGQALLRTTARLTLPDSVKREVTIGEGKPRWSMSLSGIDHRDPSGFSMHALRNEDQMEIDWSLPQSPSAKQQSWCMPEGLCSALTFLDGKIPQILFKEVHRKGRTYCEVWGPRQPLSLDIIFRPYDSTLIDRNQLVELTAFFAQDSEKANICRHMLGQIIEASRQQSWEARELLLSTIFEAVLRTLYQVPFIPNKQQDFQVDEYLTQFAREYLTDDHDLMSRWKEVNAKAMQVRRTLRHRNAHPDWLTTRDGSDSPEVLEDKLNNAIFLSRFYGYMILGLAGFRNMEPRFPIPFDQWSPMLKIERSP